MDEQRLLEFKDELEAIATYGNEKITQKEFKEFFNDFKKYATKHGIETPEIFKYSGNMIDFRRKMQTYGGYAERRQVLNDTIYNLCEIVNKINIKENKNQDKNNNEYIDRKYIIDELKKNEEIVTKYGKIKFNTLNIKEGGNSIVVFGTLQHEEVAIKILIANSKNKSNRFLCEFANIIIKLNNLENVARLYLYDTVSIGKYLLDIIIMKKYNGTLQYDSNYTEEEIIRIFKQIIDCMEVVHRKGIVHRDLKPQNILLDENLNIIISDFGIAYYNPEIFEMTGHTVSGERLANFDFSAPEQRNSKIQPSPTMDIYAIGQIVQWLVFGETHKGTHRKKLIEKFNTKRMSLLDSIVEKCLDNNPDNRYQSIEEIKNEISMYNVQTKRKIISNEKTDKNIDYEEVKEKLIDILDNICGTDEKNKKFESYNKLNDKEVEEFLDKLEENLNKLYFFNEVGITKFINKDFYDNSLVNKMYYEELNKLYNQIKIRAPELKSSFIEYVKLAINSNVYEFPF